MIAKHQFNSYRFQLNPSKTYYLLLKNSLMEKPNLRQSLKFFQCCTQNAMHRYLQLLTHFWCTNIVILPPSLFSTVYEIKMSEVNRFLDRRICKLSRFVHFENTVDHGSVLNFSMDSGLWLS